MQIEICDEDLVHQISTMVENSDFGSEDDYVEEILKIYFDERSEKMNRSSNGGIKNQEVKQRLDSLGYLNDK